MLPLNYFFKTEVEEWQTNIYTFVVFHVDKGVPQYLFITILYNRNYRRIVKIEIKIMMVNYSIISLILLSIKRNKEKRIERRKTKVGYKILASHTIIYTINTFDILTSRLNTIKTQQYSFTKIYSKNFKRHWLSMDRIFRQL